MTKIQTYLDVSLSAVEDIGNFAFNCISTLVYLEHSRKAQCDTLQFLSCTNKNMSILYFQVGMPLAFVQNIF